MRKRPLLIVAAVVLVGVLAFAVLGIVREYIAPWVLQTIWRAYLMADSIPQVMIWAIFVAAIPVLAIFVLIQGRIKVEDDSGSQREPSTGQLYHWMRQIQRSASGDYFRRSLIRQLSELTFRTLFYRERMTEEEVKEAFTTGKWSSGSEVGGYLSQAWRRERYSRDKEESPMKRFGRLPRSLPSERDSRPWQDPNLERVIEFLEEELEV